MNVCTKCIIILYYIILSTCKCTHNICTCMDMHVHVYMYMCKQDIVNKLLSNSIIHVFSELTSTCTCMYT